MKFLDSEKRTWVLRIDLGRARRIRDEFGVDLLAWSQATFEQLQDPFTLGGILWTLIEADATKKNITVEQFSEAIDGNVIEQAGEALLEAIIDFFPPRKQALMRQLKENATRIENAWMTTTMENLNNPTLTANLDRIQKTAGETPTNSPAASASTPIDGP